MRGYRNVAIVLGMYAIVVLALGLYAFTSAPAQANKATALAVPGAIAVLAFLGVAVLIKTSTTAGTPRNAASSDPERLGEGAGRRGVDRGERSGKLGVLIAIGLPMLVGIVVPYRAMKAGKDSELYRAKTEVFRQEVADGRKKDTPEGRKTFYASQMSPDHDKSYLEFALWGIAGASGLAFAASLVLGRGALTSGKS